MQQLQGLETCNGSLLLPTPTRRDKIVAVLYPGGEAARREPRLLGCAENGLGLREMLQSQGHEYKVLTDKEQALDKELPTTDVLITTPFHPAYVTKERIAKGPNLKMVVTAGVGSDHVDLEAARQAGITVAEVTGSNVSSVAEHVVMQILILVRNFVPAYQQVVNGEWKVADIAREAFDLEGKVVGTVGCGRIGQRICQRLQPFGVKMLYHDYQRLSPEQERALGVTYVELESLVSQCDIVTINTPLTSRTDRLFDHRLLSSMKKGCYLVNTARGKIVDTEALANALQSGHLAGYAGDVWYPQPAPPNHPWRRMPRHALTPHYSGTTLDAQARYAAGVKDILTNFFQGKPLRPEDIIIQGGRLVSPSYHL
ncbi:formate dehydrogenase (NAD+) [Balamuthia mandrillaris]